MQLAGGGSAYTGTTASYVALSAVSVLALALLCSIWQPDVSGSLALLGLFGVYIASQELLVLFMVLLPASILVDLMRGLGGPSTLSGRGWLIFLQLLEMAAKAAGGFFAYQLYRAVSASPGERLQQAPYAAPPPSSVPVPGTSAYQRVQDPFAEPAYVPPPAGLGSPVGGSGHTSPLPARAPQPPQPQLAPAAAPNVAPPAANRSAPAAPQYDLM